MSAGAASPIAVFLGPSLPRETATAILTAHYFRPAQFGDVYGLIGSGVRVIVLIDGVFHGRAPVWQRELLCALRGGIRVYGAASMGALRAAELHTYGMIGVGTVYKWYVSGEIDGDDEVALLHAAPEQRYRPLTLPLVNVRSALRVAVARGLIAAEPAAAIIAHLKALPFWERTADVLWNAPVYQSLDMLQQTDLRALFAETAVAVKGKDAALALAEVARREQEPQTFAAPSSHRLPAGTSHYDRFRLLKRCFPCHGGAVLNGATLVERLISDPTQRRLLRWSFSARFFLLQWAHETDVKLPAAVAAAEVIGPPNPADRLRANSITADEYDALQARHLLMTWLLEASPEQFSLGSSLQDEALLLSLPEVATFTLGMGFSRTAIARALPYIADWCERVGAAPPSEVNEQLAARWRNALAVLTARGQAEACTPFLHSVWALEQGPAHFGYATWSLATELLSELQRTGAAAMLAAQWEASGT